MQTFQRLLVLAGFVVIPSIATSEDIMFSEDQFGAVDLVPTQSLTTNAIETLGAMTERFELVSELREDDPIRQFGRPIGRLDILVETVQSRGVATCTAALIDDDKIITNYHCIPGLGDVTVVGAQLRLGYLQQDTNDSEAFDVDVQPAESNRELDYSILRVIGNPGAKYGKVPFSPRHALDGESLFVLHHPAGKPQRLTRAFCRSTSIDAVSGFQMHHRCDTLPGSSGALVFSQVDKALVGLHHHGGLTANDPQSFNLATDSVALYDDSQLLGSICCSSPATPTTLTPATQAPARGLGWMFLGRYRRDGTWTQARSGDLQGYSPEQLTGVSMNLSQAVNLRSGPFVVTSSADHACQFDETPVTGALTAGRLTRIVQVQRLETCSSYVWALVE
ncbi:trypsin-like serine peptidase [Rhizobium leguminosarum]|uniref:trypsin-like serine peptidase n=1 Tax=Rhizobium leguminosarum TaxID=384 RepID=UPI003F9D95AF